MPSPDAPRPREHVAAFFKTRAFFLDTVVPFITEGLAAGERVIAIATHVHWNAIAERLEHAGVPYGRAAQEGRLILLDADAILEQITVDGRAMAEEFGKVLEPLLASPGRCRIYGELVSLLTQHGDVDAAVAIEKLGHEIAQRLGIDVLCSYRSDGGYQLTADDIARIEAAHHRNSREPGHRTNDATHRERPLVLIADDFSDALEMYGEYLRFLGFGVVLAGDGEEAVRLAREHEPDIVLMDVRMPRMTGTAALRTLRKEPRFERVPIIALTAHALESERDAILGDGFDGVISKPCLPDDLVATVRRTLASVPSGN